MTQEKNFFIPTVYKRAKDDTYFFKENQCKIFDLSKDCIGKVVEAKFIKEAEPFKYYRFKKITDDSTSDRMSTTYHHIVYNYHTVPVKVLIVAKQPSWLFGAIYGYSDETRKHIKNYFSHYNSPEATPFVKLSPLSHLVTKLKENGTLLVDAIIYFATKSMLYAYPCDIRYNALNMQEVTEIIKNISSRTAFYRARRLIKELSLMFKDLNMKYQDDNKITFKKDGQTYTVDIETTDVYVNESKMCIVESDLSLCKEDRAIAKMLAIISGVLNAGD